MLSRTLSAGKFEAELLLDAFESWQYHPWAEEVLSRWYRARPWNTGKGIRTVRDDDTWNFWAGKKCWMTTS